MAYCPEDRKVEGIIADLSVRENIIIALQAKRGMFHPLSKKEMEDAADKYIKLLQIKTASRETPIKSLSGGNQQKVVIAKWLTRDSEILIFDEPTRGIDVGAKNEIYKLMNRLAAEGKSIIMISSEMTEVLRMSDRIIVMCEGKITGNIDISEATQEHIMNHATRNIN